MFPGDDQLQKLIRVVGELKCELQMPWPAEEYFAVTGVVAPVPDEHRRYVRTRMRVSAALQYRRSFPSLVRAAQWHKIVIQDVSRSGLGFLHSEQLFPAEQLMLVMPDCKPRSIEVARCRKLSEACYEIGATFVQKFRGEDDS